MEVRAWEKYISAIDTDSNEWHDKGCDEIFIAGYRAARTDTSDLEIVQKALDEGEVLTLWGDKIWCVESRYKDNVSGCHLESLLIWAKEQGNYERSSNFTDC